MLLDLHELSPRSQEVVWGSAGHMRLSTSWGWIEYEEIVVHLLINLHDTSFVTAPIAVVGCREDCDYFLLVTPIVSLKGSK